MLSFLSLARPEQRRGVESLRFVIQLFLEVSLQSPLGLSNPGLKDQQHQAA